jgi:hypothetical protein
LLVVGCWFAPLLCGWGASAAPAGKQQPAANDAFFTQQVRPVLEGKCFACHSGEKAQGGLKLTSREGVLKGGASGPAAVPGKPAASALVAAINYHGRRMPPQGKLPQTQIDTLTRWVAMGLPWPGGAQASLEPRVQHGPPQVTPEAKRFWSFRKVVRPPVPSVKGQGWVRTPIDAFVLKKLEAAGLKPNPQADRIALLRRATYDLTGLPPTPQEVQQFLADASPRAWERVVDRLLASPRYGEKWGRHWLDLVRFGESNSYERDGTKPHAWRYRDYVIRAFNQDRPYDRFILEQLAADLFTNDAMRARLRATRAVADRGAVTSNGARAIETANTEQRARSTEPSLRRKPEHLIATGYYRLGVWDDEPVDPEQALYDDLDDIVSTTGQVFLGLTLGCARCHDHKLDPIPQKDYYRFLAFFNGVRRYGIRSNESVEDASVRPIALEVLVRKNREEVREYRAKLRANRQAIEAIEARIRPDLSPVEKEEWETETRRLPLVQARVPRILTQEEYDGYAARVEERERLRRSAPPALDSALCVTEIGPTPRETFVLQRGNPHAKGEKVEPGFPSVLSPPAPRIEPSPYPDTSGRRLALARWIASPDNPLTARVMVNRVWQYHFGRGLVRSSSDFGFQGDRPTHPELLDWLASTFTAQGGRSAAGWRLKPLHRMIMLSSTYRMSSRVNPRAWAKDPRNDLLWRFDMRRLQAEEVRDSILAVNGSLNLKMGGPGFYPTIPEEVLAGQSQPGANWGKSDAKEQARRSVYIFVKRSLITPILASFDGPETDLTCPIRFSTTQPTQALGLLNSAFLHEQAKVFAESLVKKAGPNPAAQVKLALWRVTQRPPTAREIERGVRSIETLQRDEGLKADEALTLFCVVALNLNEFIYLD